MNAVIRMMSRAETIVLILVTKRFNAASVAASTCQGITRDAS